MASVSNIHMGTERKVHLPSLSLHSAYPRFPPTCPIYTYQPIPFMITHINFPIIYLLDPCALQRIQNLPPISLIKWMCRSTTIPTEITWIKPPLQTTANLLDAIQAKLNLCHYRLPQRFLFLYRIRSSYNRLLGLPQQGCKCFSFFRVAVCERGLWNLSFLLDSIRSFLYCWRDTRSVDGARPSWLLITTLLLKTPFDRPLVPDHWSKHIPPKRSWRSETMEGYPCKVYRSCWRVECWWTSGNRWDGGGVWRISRFSHYAWLSLVILICPSTYNALH
jgi:hypothetical protein